jgi:hypothetical protein
MLCIKGYEVASSVHMAVHNQRGQANATPRAAHDLTLGEMAETKNAGSAQAPARFSTKVVAK